METVDVIMTASLKSIQGPVQTIKRIRNNHDFFYERGYDVSIFTLDNLQETVAERIRGNESTIVKHLKAFARYLSLHSWIYSWYRVRHLFTSSHRILRYYQSLGRKPDMIVFHSIFDCYMYLKYYRIEGAKISCFTHSDGLLFKMLLHYYPRLQGGIVERKLMKIADYVMSNVDVKPCIAKIEEKNLLNKYPQLQGKTCLVVNAIDDLDEEQKSISRKIKTEIQTPAYRMVCTGSINGRKGQHIILEAMAELPRTLLQDMLLTIVGDGPEKIALENFVKEHELERQVIFTGAVANTEVYKELARSNIFILMSKNEGLPIALIEGLRSGLALISTKVSGIPELIEEGSNGILLNPDKDELVKLLSNMKDYDWNKMGAESRKLFEDYYVFTRMRADYAAMLGKGLGDTK